MADLSNDLRELASAIRAGDCVLWTGVGLGALAGRPTWPGLLRALLEEPEAERGPTSELVALLERNEASTVLGWFLRHHGDVPLARVLAKHERDDEPAELPASLTSLARLPWRAVLATAHLDLLARAHREVERPIERLSLRDGEALSLPAQGPAILLGTPPTGRLGVTGDLAVRELVEEIVLTRSLVLLGFELGDPDLEQLLSLLRHIGKPPPGLRHVLFVGQASTPEAEQLRAEFGIELLRLSDDGLAGLIASLTEQVGAAPAEPSEVEKHLLGLELHRILRAIPLRADFAVDAAWTIDPHELDETLELLRDRHDDLPARDLLRLGCVWLTQGKLERARKVLQQVITRGSTPELERLARFDLALLTLAEGDEEAARLSLEVLAEEDRNLALVPPRYVFETVRGRVGSRVWVDCRERGGDRPLTIEVGALDRPVTPHDRRRFCDAVAELSRIEHEALVPVVEGFAEGRSFGVVMQRVEGVPLSRVLSETDEPLGLDRSFELLGPLMDALALAASRNLVHRNLHPRHVLITPEGAKLRGFGFAPLVHWARPAIVRENLGYIAPELLAGATPSVAGDVYALGALIYRCVTGRLPQGVAPRPTSLVASLDARVDELLAKVLHPDPSQRPEPRALRSEIATILTTPHLAAKTEAGKLEATRKLAEPEDPDDLEGWTFLLEHKPAHLPAREAISRIEREARARDRWDRVAEVLAVRARLSQAEGEKIVLLRELAEIYERRLAAPANALEAYLGLIDAVSASLQLPLVDELLRLGQVTGRWAAVADRLVAVGKRLPKQADQLRVLLAAGRIYFEELAALPQAKLAYEQALDLEPDNLPLQRAMLAVQRKLEDPAELATTLLTIAELESGPARREALLEAAELLDRLEEHEGALEAAELVRAEEPDNLRALAIVERCARVLERKPLLATALAARAEGILDDREAAALRREAAELMRELGDEAGAIAQLRRLIERDRSDRSAAAILAELLRAKLRSDADAISAREGLIDALSVLAETSDNPSERAELLAESASLLDREPDGGERAADCRERIIDSLPIDHPRVAEAVAGLVRWYRAQEDWERLADLHERRAKAEALDVAQRVNHWRELWELLRSGVTMPDETRERRALEQLAALEPDNGRWRDLLISGLMEQGDQTRAEALLSDQIQQAQSPSERASLLVSVARMRERAGDLQQAEARVREALELDETHAPAWQLLSELLDQRERPIEALEARERAAQHTRTSADKIAGLFAVAQTWITALERGDRGLPLLEQVVDLDEHHAPATTLLVETLVARGELERAWPHAQRHVAQVRARDPENRPANAQALALAGRCALAVHAKDQARELLRRAKEADPRNREVTRTLAQLELESGHYEEALRAYQALTLQATEASPREQASLYLAMARARQGMGEASKAVQMVERALDLDGESIDALRLLVELHAGEPVRMVEAEQRLIHALEQALDKLPSEDSRRPAQAQELLDRRLELATTLADKLNRPREAVAQMQAVLARRGDDIGLLHKALDLYSHAEQWRDAVEVLDRLAGKQSMGAVQAKYLYAAAVLVRDHGLDAAPGTTESEVRRRLLAVLEADPLHEKANKALGDLLEQLGDWRELSKLLRNRLKNLPESTEPEARVALLDRIAGLYETKLGDRQTALIAYEQAIAMAPASAAPDSLLARRNKVITLAVQVGGDALDKAIVQVQALVDQSPLEYDNYHRLVELYLAAKQRDAAVAVSRTLRFLKQADEAELELANELGENFRPPRGSITRKQWREILLAASPQLSDLFGLIWPIVAAREGQTHQKLGLDRNAREPVSLQSPGLARWVAFMAQVLDMPPPELFSRKGAPGDFAVLAPGDAQGFYPTLVARDDALAKQTDAVIAFRVGRALARVHPHLLAAALLPSSSSLRDAIYGAVALTHPQVAIPKELRDPAKSWGQTLERGLPQNRLDELKKGVARVIERGGADTKSWLRGADMTAVRVGFLVSDSLDVAARVILAGGAGAQTEGRELIKGLVAFSVSAPYLALRRSLKLG